MASPSTADVGLRAKAREWRGFYLGHRGRVAGRREAGYLADV